MSNARNLSKLLGTDTQITTPDIADGVFQANKNLIINGAMQVWQRATAATAANNSYNTVDRFYINKSNDGAYTTEQSTDTPTGTGFSLKAQVTTADTSISAAQYAYIHQNIEAQNLQALQYGTSAAKSITLSFWVKSNKTGTYTIVVRKLDTTTYHLVIEYTINSANTWEKKEITISPTAGGTSLITASGGAIANDNGTGFQIGWNLAFGSNYNGATNNTWTTNTNHYATANQVNWMDSTSNNFYLTQIQLEVGSTATPFEHRSYGDELARCQRYYYRVEGENYECIGMGRVFNTDKPLWSMTFPVSMRATPSVSTATATSIGSWYNAVGNFVNFQNIAIYQSTGGSDVSTISLTADSVGTISGSNNPQAIAITGSGLGHYIDFSAEL